MVSFGYLAFIVTALHTLRIGGVATAILTGTLLTMLLALTLYYFFPQYGVFPELLDDGLIVERLGGAAHPNSVGRTMSVGLILTLFLHRAGALPTNVAVALSAGFVLTVYLTWSRSAMAAGMFGLMVLYWDVIRSRVGAATVATVAMAGLIFIASLFAFGREDQLVGKVLSKFAKTGTAEEITSGTGRAEIWAKAISLIDDRLLIGHGFGAAPSLMINHSQATHNVILHATLAAGIGGGVLMLGLLLWNAYLMVSYHSLLIRALCAFLLLGGIAEDAVLETFPGPCTLSWLMCCFHPVLIRHPGVSSSVPRAEPASD